MATLSPAVRAFLEEKRYCVFADIGPDGLPHQTVLWYEPQGDEIMMNIGRQRVKNRNLRRDPRASFCIEDGYRYLTFTGTCSLQWEDQEAAQADIKRLAVRYEGAERAEEMSANQFTKEERMTVRLAIESMDVRGM